MKHRAITWSCPWRALLLGAMLVGAADGAERVTWEKDFSEGMRRARAAQRPALVDFWATWCGWCKVMDREVYANPQVAAALAGYVCIKVDVDKDPDTAFAFHIGSLPRAIVIDPEGRMVGDRIGYLPVDQFLAFLADAAGTDPGEAPRAPGLQRAEFMGRLEAVAGTASTNAQAVAELAGHLDHPEAAVREVARASLEKIGSAAIPALVERLGDDYLGTRIAAYQALTKLADAAPPFDPWAGKAERADALRVWTDWLASRAP